MVKLAKGAKLQGKPKKAPPPEEVDDSEEDEEMEEESSEEEVEVPVKKTPAKKAATPAKATPGKKAATPAKPAATPGKKATPAAAAKNGKRAKKQDSEDEEESDEEEEMETVTKNAAKKKPVAKNESESEEEDDEDDEEDEDDESEEEKPVAKKLPAKKPVAKKPAKEESEDEEDSEDEEMEIAAPVAKGKKAVPAKKEESEEDDDDDDEEEDDDDDEEEDDEEEKVVKDSGKRKKELAKTKDAPEAKKQKTESRNEGLSVFVANLNTSKNFDELKDGLREFFSKKSLEVQDVRLGASKRFAYVEFSTIEEVEKAITLNGKKMLGLEVKVEKANTPADKAKIAEDKKDRDSRTLFVKNIPYSTSAEDLQEIFTNAKEIRLPTQKDGSSKGIAYVEFNTEAEADKAKEEKQGAEVEGRSIFIDHTGEKSLGSGRGGPQGESKVLLLNNLSYSATEDGLQDVFEKATSIRLPQNQQGRPKGFAFIEFPSVEDAKEALENHNNTEIEGRTIRLEFSLSGGGQGRGSVQSKTLFVRGLSEDTTEESLRDAFDGAINSRIVTDRETGASKGFGFVDFSNAEEAKAAKEAMEDGEIDGNKVTLDFAKPKGDGQRGGRGGFGGRGGGRGGFGGRGGGRGGFGGRGGGRGGFGGRGGRGFGGRGGGGFRGGNQGGRGKKTKFDD